MLSSGIAIKVFTFKRALMGTFLIFVASMEKLKSVTFSYVTCSLQMIVPCRAHHRGYSVQHTARRFGLTVSLKKSEVLYQPKLGSSYTPPVVKVYDRHSFDIG